MSEVWLKKVYFSLSLTVFISNMLICRCIMIDITRAVEVAHEYSAAQRSLRRTRFMKRREQRAKEQQNNTVVSQRTRGSNGSVCKVLDTIGLAKIYQPAQIPQTRDYYAPPANELGKIQPKKMSESSNLKEMTPEEIDLDTIVEKMEDFIERLPRSNFSRSLPSESTWVGFVLHDH